MQLATWNVNSLKMRLQHVLDWLAANPVDFLCLQETKLTDDKFPKDEIEAAGYGVIFTGQPTYNGVALLYRKEAGYVPEGVQLNNPLHEDVQRRLVSARFQTAAGPVRVIGAYFPNGQAVGSEKYVYKLGWIASLQEWIAQLRRDEPDTGVILAGDFNMRMCMIRRCGPMAFWCRGRSGRRCRGCWRWVCTMRSGCSSSRRSCSAGGTTGRWVFGAMRDCALT